MGEATPKVRSGYATYPDYEEAECNGWSIEWRD